MKHKLFILPAVVLCLLAARDTEGRIPFRMPFTMTVYDVEVGAGWYGANPYYLLDSTETEVGAIESGAARVTMGFSADFFKYNVLQLIWNQNIFDYHVGLNIKYQRNMIPVNIPEYWPQLGGSSQQTTRFRPAMWGLSLAQTVIIQPRESYFLQFDYHAGYGKMWLYSDYIGNRYVNATHPIQTVGFGIKWNKIDVLNSRLSLGLTYRYHWLPFPDIPDPDELAPVSALNMSSHGIYFSMGMLLGGGKTVGDEARKSMKKGEYLRSASQFQDFLKAHPDHFRVPLAKKYLRRLDDLIPYEYFEMAEEQLDAGNLDKALKNYNLASTVEDSALIDTIRARKDVIGKLLLDQGTATHQKGELSQAEDLYTFARSISEAVKDSVSRRLVRLHYDRADKFIRSQMWEASLRELNKADSIGNYPEYEEIRYDLRFRIANGYLADAGRAAEEGATIAAVDFVQRALAMSEQLREKADDALKILHAQNWYTIQDRLHRNIRDELAEGQLARKSSQRKMLRISQVEVGMERDVVRELYGPPGEVFERRDLFGQLYQLWVYRLTDRVYEYVYFRGNFVTKVEQVRV